MADPAQTPPRGDWVCPCNGCKKAAKQERKMVAYLLTEAGYTDAAEFIMKDVK
jgi:hypothetical protein